ncbi:MAG: cation:proton antiporter [Acetobacteraceae bacterium]|nr:cation:proton antiporter [Acetobacteraceae bacterium]
MEQSVDPAAFHEPLIILVAAGVLVPLLQRAGISSVLAFILVGFGLGPYGLGALAPAAPWLSLITFTDTHTIGSVAQLGVVLLLFAIGLELTFERLIMMRRLVFGLGALQVALSGVILGVIAELISHRLAAAVVIGLGLAMSSTAVVAQVLSESRKLHAPVGRTSFAVLLFQDLSVVPVLFAIGILGQESPGVSAARLGAVIGQALLAILGTIGVGRILLRPLFRLVGQTNSPELFMAACLLVVIATGLVTAIAGLSMSLGALLAGLLLAETEYSRQVEVVIDPFKGLLLGVFLVSVGMSLNPHDLVSYPAAVLAAAVALIGVKLAIVVGLVRLFGSPFNLGLRAGLLLAPGGEFSFVVLSTAAALRLISEPEREWTVMLVALTMASIPLLHRLGVHIEDKPVIDPDLLVPASFGITPRVIVAGFGRVGQIVAAMLEVHDIAYVAVDRDVDNVSVHHRAGKPVYYGDITRIELLRLLGLETARALAVTLDNDRDVDALVRTARQEREDLLIISRARDARHAAHLYRIGASVAVPETIEASLQLCEALLVDIGIPMGPVIASIHEKRAELQALVKAMAPQAQVRQFGRRRLREAVRAEERSGV